MDSATSLKSKLITAIVVGGLTLALLTTALTGIAWHEWLGIAVTVVILIHMLLGWQWIASITRRLFKSLPGATRLEYILDLLLFAAITVTIYSGLMISRVAVPALGLTGLAPSFAWRGLHSLAANSLLILVGLHLALSWSWIVKTVRRFIIDPLRPGPKPGSTANTSGQE